MGGNKKERKTHHCCLLHVTCERGKAAVGSYSESQLRESKLHNGRKNSLIEKDFSEKKLGSGGGLKTHRQTHNNQLGVALLHCLRVSGVWRGCGNKCGGPSGVTIN